MENTENLTAIIIDLVENVFANYTHIRTETDCIRYIADILSVIHRQVATNIVINMYEFIAKGFYKVNTVNSQHIIKSLKINATNRACLPIINNIIDAVALLMHSEFNEYDISNHIRTMQLLIHDYRIDERINAAVNARILTCSEKREVTAKSPDVLPDQKQSCEYTKPVEPANAITNLSTEIRRKADEISYLIQKMVDNGDIEEMTIVITRRGITINEEL